MDSEKIRVLIADDHPLFRDGMHGLLDSVPAAAQPGRPLRPIRGMAPSASRLPAGCAFRARCDRADDACVALPELAAGVRCHHPLC